MDRRIAYLSAALAACTPEGDLDLTIDPSNLNDTPAVDTVDTAQGGEPVEPPVDASISYRNQQFTDLLNATVGRVGSELCPPEELDCGWRADYKSDAFRDTILDELSVTGENGNCAWEDLLARRFPAGDTVVVASTPIAGFDPEYHDAYRTVFTLVHDGETPPLPDEMGLVQPQDPTFYCNLITDLEGLNGSMECHVGSDGRVDPTEISTYFYQDGINHSGVSTLNLNGTTYSNVGAVTAGSFADAARRMKEAAASVREHPEVFNSTLTND